MDRKLGGLIFLLLAGCASGPPPPDLLQVLGARFVGGSVQAVAAQYGTPDEQRDFEGQKIYIWRAKYVYESTVPVRTNTYGAVGGYPYGGVPYSQTTTTDQPVANTYECRMEVAVDQSGTVTNLGLFGQMGGCQQFRIR